MAGAKGTPLKAFAIFLLAAAIGTAGGLLGVGFQKGLDWIQHVLTGQGSHDHLADAVRALSVPWIVLVPTIGGVAAGVLLLLVPGKKAPFGITDIIGLVQLRKGGLRLRDSVLQILSSACTIGSGGSIGREGANSHIAATVSSALARAFDVGSRTRSVLLGCGIAAGMATSYNAPIAGALFVMEAVLGNFAMDVFAPIVVASVIATMIRRVLLGEGAIYHLPEELQALSWQLVFTALLLGCLCGVGGILFRWSINLGRRAFHRLRLPKPVVLGLGGLAVGVIGIWVPETWGNGYEMIEDISRADFTPAVGLVFSLFLWKMVATACTVGSGGLGGIFTPNLVVGAAFGASFGAALQWLLGSTVAAATLRLDQITFTFVGMAGLTAATMHAPITSVVLVFELTRHYELMLPLMLCSITASVVARMLDQDNYYTEALRLTGEELPTGLEELAIKTTYVRDVMRTDVVTVRDAATFDEVMDLLANRSSDTIYVLDAGSVLIGRIQLQDVKNFINDPTLSSVVIAADLTRPAIAVPPEATLAAAMARFEDPQLTELAVVDTPLQQHLRGRVNRQDVIASISDEVLGQQKRAHFRGADGRKQALPLPAGFELARIPVPDAWIGLVLDAVPPKELAGITPVLMVRRQPDGPEQLVPAGLELVLEAGTELMVIATAEALQRVRGGGGGEE